MCPIWGNTDEEKKQYLSWIPALPVTSCVALGKLLNISELPILHL